MKENINKKLYSNTKDMLPGSKKHLIPSPKNTINKLKISVIKGLKSRDFKFIQNAIKGETSNFLNFLKRREKVTCPCCGWKGVSFIAHYNWRDVAYQSICPNCGSRSRHRGLIYLYKSLFSDLKNAEVLVFSPEEIITEFLNRNFKFNIKSTDKYIYDVDFPNEDIQDLSFPDSSFDIVLCNHVLEHIPDDDLALKECFRILKRNGIAVFTIPGDFFKKNTWILKEQDSNGHYRHYGLDVVKKMEQYFTKVEAVDLNTLALHENQVRKHDYGFVCFK